MRKGIVTHIDILLGKGFIEDENQQDISFPLNYTHHAIRTGSRVEFEIALGTDGLFATDVQSIALNEAVMTG
ncbi:hypothetical protein OC25_01810 [Pedobacter kyungheensis]|uniref:Uncharacterized protein n=1 Tax=Pedobacter kyungheensis TaxID=1069985 RepID=A0A0C1FXC1_9SPHI|nr:cold shock domain-containing protein [Pedobacter kyungheensis]KIA96513.1 hypothetical protein OC25_01810 [Pedobacter kyungheensis]